MPAERSPLVAYGTIRIRVEPSCAVHARGGVVRLAGVEEPALVREDVRAEGGRTGPDARGAGGGGGAAGVGAPLRRLRLRPPPRSRPVGTPIGTPVVKVVVVHRTRTLAPAVDAAVAVFVAAVVALARSDRRGRRPRAEVVPGQQRGRGGFASCVVPRVFKVVKIVVVG